MPTSHNMIIYALAASGKASIGSLILAGIVPAVLLSVCNLAAAYYVAVKRGYPALQAATSEAMWRAIGAAVPGLLVMVIILGGIVSGIFTATESASVAVIYSILLTFFLYRTMTWDHFLQAAAKAAKTTGVVLLLIGVSTMFQYLMGLYSVADLAGAAMATVSNNPWVIFFLINLILFILGTFMDMASTILICTPIFLPIAMAHGMDPVQFGMVMLINCAPGPEHAAGRHHAVHRLRHRRHLGRRGDEVDPAVLHRPDRGLDAGHLCAGLQPDAAPPVRALIARPLDCDHEESVPWRKLPFPAPAAVSAACCARLCCERGVDLRSAGGTKPLTALSPREEVMHGDLRDPAVVDRMLAGVDVLIHMAGTSVERPLPEIIENNLKALYEVYEGARRHGVKRVVFASSNHTVGMYPVEEKLGLDCAFRPDGFYGLSKVWGEAMSRMYWDKHGIEGINLRIGSTLPRPTEFRNLSTWLGHDDLLQLIMRCIEAPDIGYLVVWGVSNNTRSYWDNSGAERLGYRPVQNSEDYAEEILKQPNPLDPVAQRFQGGSFVTQDYTPPEQRPGV